MSDAVITMLNPQQRALMMRPLKNSSETTSLLAVRHETPKPATNGLRSIMAWAKIVLMVTLSFVFALQSSSAAEGDQVKIDGTERKKIRESDLIRRYPVGKHWSASKVLRVQGVSKNKDWGFEGEQHVVYTNRYQSTVQVLDNDLGELKLQVLVVDASQQRIVTKQKLRLADFGKASPILALAVSRAGALVSTHPAVLAAGPMLILWGKIDPQYEKTLTRLVELSSIDISTLSPNTQLSIVDDPEPINGCTFEVVWTNGLGVTLCRQTAGPVTVKLDEIRNWARTADPLFDFYIMDTMNRNIGDRWEVDGRDAVNVLSSQGASDSDGSLSLKYLRDSEFASRPCRHLAIQDGRLGVLLDREDRETEATAANIQGQILYDKYEYLVLEANGTCDFSDKVKSKDHLLFEAEWQRDVDVDFRYEAELIDNGGK